MTDTLPVTQALLPCPFCGDHAKIEHSYREDDNRYPRDFWHVRVKCQGCGIELPDWTSYGNQEQKVANFHVKEAAERDAASLWNTRSSSTAGSVGAEAIAWLYEGPDGEHYIRGHRNNVPHWLAKNGWKETPLVAALAASSNLASAGDETLREAEAWLRAISDWLLANDHDMALPNGVLDTDPLDIADKLRALSAPDEGEGQTNA